jgi:hypothetical protein
MAPATEDWTSGYFVSIAQSTGIPFVTGWTAACATLSCMANFLPQLAMASRAIQAAAG